MELTAARTLAEKLIAEHIPTKGFQFEFDNAQNRLGLCDFARKRISMGRVYVESETIEGVTQTLLHEIGHAMAGPSAKHGPRWYTAARSIGYIGKSHGDNPAATAKHEAALEYALSQVDAMKDRTSGQFLPGERVQGNRISGIFIEARVKNALVWDEAKQKTWSIPLTAIARIGGHSAHDEQIAAARAASATVADITTGPLRIGETVNMKPGFKPLTAIVYGFESPKARSRVRRVRIVVDNGDHYVTNETNLVRVVTKGARATSSAAVASKELSLTRGTPVVINYPKSKWHRAAGVIEKVNPKTIKVKLETGEVLNAPKSFLVAA